MEDITNEIRADWALRAVQQYAALSGALGQESIEVMVSDLIASLRHLCDAYGLDHGNIQDRMHGLYLEEVDQDGGTVKRRVDPMESVA